MTVTAPRFPRRAAPRPSARCSSGLLRSWGPPFLVFVVAIVFWEWYTAGEGRRLIPGPSTIGQAIVDQRELLWQVDDRDHL